MEPFERPESRIAGDLQVPERREDRERGEIDVIF
jgi:hypothetical protein